MIEFLVPIVLVVSFLIVLIIDEYKEIMSLSREVAVELRKRLMHHLIFAGVLFLIGGITTLFLPDFIAPEVALFISAGVLLFALAGAITAVIESRLRRKKVI